MISAPNLVIKPKQHQLELLSMLRNSPHLGVGAWHGMGMGKTLSALWAGQEIIGKAKAEGSIAPKILVICPKSAKPTWHQECSRNTPHLRNHLIVVPYSQLKNLAIRIRTQQTDIRLIVFDESHYIKSVNTDRIKRLAEVLNAIGSLKYQFKYGKILPMTGTPLPNCADELFTTWTMCTSKNLIDASKAILDENRFAWWRGLFANEREVRFKTGKRDPHTGKPIIAQALTYEGVKMENLSQLHQLLSPVVHYRRVEDCLDLPKVNEQYIDLEFSDDKLLEDANLDKPEAYMSLQAKLNQAKIPYMLEWVDNFLSIKGEQLVVFSLFTDALRALQAKFPNEVRLIIGDIGMKERTEILEQFQAKQLRVVGLSYGAGAESLNLQVGRNTLYNGYPWNDAKLRQAMARTHRQGQVSMTNHYFLMSGLNDIKNLHRVRRKGEASKAVEEGLLKTSPTALTKVFSGIDDLI